MKILKNQKIARLFQLSYEVADALHLDRDILELIVGSFDIHQRYVFVAIAGIGIFLAVTQQWVVVVFSEADGFLRAILYAGEAKFATAFGVYAL